MKEGTIKYVIVILVALLSYTVIERILRHFSVLKSNRDPLWSGVWYYLYGICLLVSLLAIRPIDFVFKIPSRIGFSLLIIGVMMLFLLLNLKEGNKIYYPTADNILKCVNFSVIQPLFEEVAFQGIILPILAFLFKEYFRAEIIIAIDGILFALFRKNCWSFIKESSVTYFFIQGGIFAYIAYTTQSIWLLVIYRVLLNITITVYKNKKAKA